MPNQPSRKGLQTGHWQNPGSYSKKRIFGPKMAKIRPFWAILVRNSETKTLKIDPKVPNRPSRKGLQTGHWQNPGSYSKKRIFGPKMAKIRPFWAILVRNSETKTLKIDPKVPNRPSRKGLQTGHWRNSGSYSKKQIFGLKSGPVAGKRTTGKLKLSRVTSGYGGLKIPLGLIRLTPKNGGYMGVA